MPLTRFEKLDAQRRARLLGAAAQEFASAGPEQASLGRIALKAGMSKPALYYYFQDKADLYATVVRWAWELLSPEGQVDLENLDRESFWPTLRRVTEANIERCREEPWLVAVAKLAYHPPREGSGARAIAELHARAHAFLRALIRRGQALGVVRLDLPEELLAALLTGADQGADHWLVDHWEELGAQRAVLLSQRVFDAIQGMLEPTAEA
jgi:AcrR family transcriptional regulator